MIKLSDEQIKAISSLKGNHSFYKFTELLEFELQFSITGLMKAVPDKVQPLQGRAQLLDELLKIIQD